MKIDDNLDLVIPVRVDLIVTKKKKNGKVVEEGEEIPVVWAYHTPISQEVFEANFRILSLAKSALFGKGMPFAIGTGPVIAALTLRDEAEKDAQERGEDVQDPARSFLVELKRLTMIAGPSENGYKPLPVDAAISSGMIDPGEWKEAESSLVFFTLAWCLAKRNRRTTAMKSAAQILGGSCTSSGLSEWAASLTTSTAESPTGTGAGS